MRKLLKTSPFVFSAVLGFIFLIPLIVLEVINRWQFQEGFPFALFIFLWVSQTLFIFILIPVIETFKSGKPLTKNPMKFLLQIGVLIFITYIWISWVSDQWPCFMGVPDCD